MSTRATRQKAAKKDEIPSVYMDMLSGEGSSHDDEGTRPLKKRKIAESKNEEAAPVSQTDEDVAGPESEPQPQLQTVIDDSESDSDGMDWEDVDIGDNADYLLKAPDQQEQTETLEINVGDSSSARPTLARARRKALTAAEKRSRVQLHKMHLLCLLFNSHIRNAWCNDEKVQVLHLNFLACFSLIGVIGFSKKISECKTQILLLARPQSIAIHSSHRLYEWSWSSSRDMEKVQIDICRHEKSKVGTRLQGPRVQQDF